MSYYIDYSQHEYIIESLDKINSSEDLYNFFIFNSLLHKQLRGKDKLEKNETCIRMSEILI